MSVLLYRLGKFAYRRKWLVLVAWLLSFVAIAGLSSSLAKPFNDDFTMPNLPSERATEILDAHFPGMSDAFSFDAVTGTYVIAAPAGEKLTDPKNRQAVDALVAKIAGMEIVDDAETPLESPIKTTEEMDCLPGANVNRQTDQFRSDCSGAPINVLNATNPDSVATLEVHYTIAKWQDIKAEQREAVYAIADQARAAGLEVEVAGSIALEQEVPGGVAELIGMGVALIVMVIAFGALVAPLIPILTALIGLGTAMMLITMGTAVTDVPSFTTFLASMIGIALSIDYALFIVSRFKHELQVSPSPEEAAGRAVGTAGTAVVFAGLTVVIALSGLSIVGVRFLTFMGGGAALAASMAVIVALTLMPALLGVFGKKLFKPNLPFARHDPEDDTQITNGVRVAKAITKRPAIALIGATAILLLLALPAIKLNLGLPGDESLPKDSTIRKAYDLRTGGFGEGSNGVLFVAVELSGVAENRRDAALDALEAELKSSPDVDYVVGPTRSDDGAGATFQGVPKSGPNNQKTKDLVRDLRGAEDKLKAEYGIEYGVTGTTAIYADVDHVMLRSIVPYLAVVAGAAFLLLTLVFRSVLIPLAAAGGFLLSMAATFGATVLIFQEGALGLISEPRPIVSFMPIMLIGLVFGLAMDYTLFTVTRMREEYVHGQTPTQAVIRGYHHGARVVTAAAIIMISVFSAFMLETDVTAKSMGFALAVAVLLDAFVVRMVILPALLTLLGDKAWWLPAWLDKILPRVDVEGDKLRKQIAPTAVEPDLVH